MFKVNISTNTLTSARGSPASCKRQCDENPNCKGFIYNADGSCDFKSDVSIAVEENGHTLYSK